MLKFFEKSRSSKKKPKQNSFMYYYKIIYIKKLLSYLMLSFVIAILISKV